MAVEETEYYSIQQGNGVSGGVREIPSIKAKPTKKIQSSRSKPAMTSFLQGITLGTVLLIPVGVWCWVKIDGTTAVVSKPREVVKTKASKGKGAPVAAKRKPMKLLAPASAKSIPTPSGGPARIAEVDPPPAIPTQVPIIVPQAVTQPPQVSEEFVEAQKAKKGFLRTLAAPFSGKGKAAVAPAADPEGQNF